MSGSVSLRGTCDSSRSLSDVPAAGPGSVLHECLVFWISEKPFWSDPSLPALVIHVHSHLSFLCHTALFRGSTCTLVLSGVLSLWLHTWE